MSSFCKGSLSSALSVLLTGALLLYTIPAPLSAQMPKLPIPIKPPAMPGAGGEKPETPPPATPAQASQEAPVAPPMAAGQGTMPLPDDRPPFHVLVIEGEGAINNVHQTVNRAATVLVEDENKTPLSGVAVSFFLPPDGPSGLFPNGSRVFTAFTDEKGMAASRPIRFNPLIGIMPIRVQASLFSQTANATITQTNVATGQAIRSYVSPVTRNQEPSSGVHIPKKVWVTAIIVGAGVAAGVILLNRTTPPAASVGTGTTGTIGAPH